VASERVSRAVGLAVAALTLAASAARAQAPAEPPPLASSPLAAAPAPSGAPAGSACFPACREGFICTADARCVSLCNPPCPSDQVCVEGRRCDVAPSSAPIYEPPPPPRVTFAERSHSLLAFHYGFSSTVDVAGEDGPESSVLGVNVRTDMPVAKYFLVGPMLEFGVYDPAYYFDLDLTLRARIPIDAGAVQFQIWAGMPIGLTLSFLKDEFAASFRPDVDGFALGWNIGVLFGGAVHFSREFGLFTELGWQQHVMSHARGTGSVELVLHPWIWNAGFVFRG
jgi:hypothetical protein